jgi:outer membrane protein insertion porin family
MLYIKLKYISLLFLLFSFLNSSNAEIVNEIKITGNERITSETVSMFADISVNDNLDQDDINALLKRLYNSNFFNNVEISLKKNTLNIFVQENPIIDKIIFEGIKAKKIKIALTKNLLLKSRSSFNKSLLKKDKDNIKITLKSLGYYFSKVDILVEEINDNKIILNYKIKLGEKSKIQKISFIGNKIYKNKKLRSVIVSEEYKFWKFISGKKFLNEKTLNIDKRMLKNFYLSKGFYNAKINSSFAKLIDKNQFELIFNIDAGDKVFFGEINLNIPSDFDENNFNSLKNLFSKISGKPYSINSVNKILEEIEQITISEEYHSIVATVDERIESDKINLDFNIKEVEKLYVEKINIYGNNITRENVIRNQLEIDEGDPFNEILHIKSINNIKSLNFFKNVKSKVNSGKSDNTKTIDIFIEEKATGEISAGAGIGTSGGTIAFSVKENNYLGKGISLEANSTVTQESIKGLLSITNPNYNNSDKSLNFSVQATELDRITNFGYKNNKVGFSIGTDFEYLDDLNFGLATSTFYEKIETDSTASTRQKKQEGNYFDTFVQLNFNYDKRNQKFQTSDGFRSRYFVDLPIISETNTLINSFDYKHYSELFDQNISTASFLFKAANSINNKDIKLSERLFVPSNKLRGFEKGKIGPKDGNDYIGGNFLTSINFTTTIPQILENAQNVDFAVFFDAATVWGVDYDSSINAAYGGNIRSSIGIGVDWFTIIGPLNFSLAHPIRKEQDDKTEAFRFNIGTAF